ncbi:DUF1904 family protein [Paenibacillus hamazuiensis]|uniref:DUF1904 family protein n=1 Tax=Paenibacillus hamazuiensis TaxID=2936508 RepID=UPI00200E5ABB|nr:DUF1904 family protein [Paenibacillus hamazuiensis]
MPFIRFHGFDEGFLKSFSPLLKQQLSVIMGVHENIVKIELVSSQPISDLPKYVEILMFPRPQEAHDVIAKWLNDQLEQRGFPKTHIFFVLLAPSLYYKEGKPLVNYTYAEWPAMKT